MHLYMYYQLYHIFFQSFISSLDSMYSHSFLSFYFFFIFYWYFLFFFFFFQAEDGIRDADVTGVQTCALPISSDYLYIISYPQWGGTRIVNDPDYSAFYQPSSNAGLLILIFIAVAVAAVVGGVFAFMMRRRKTSNMGITTAGQAPPTQGPAGQAIPGR